MIKAKKKAVYVIAVANPGSNFAGRRFGLQFHNGTVQTVDAKKAEQFKALGYSVTTLINNELEQTE